MEQIENKYDWIGDFIQGVAIVKKNGKYGAMMVGGKEILPTVYEALSNFEGGYATATYNGENRLVNLSGQIQIKKGEELVFLPEDYDWACDFHHGFVSVNKNDKWGIANTNFDLVIPCIYEYIEAISTNRFKFREDSKWGIIDIRLNVIANAQFENISHITNKYFKVHVYIKYCSGRSPRYGIIDENGHIIIPAEFEAINEVTDGVHLFWIVDTGKKGVINEDGDTIIPPIYDNIKLSDGLFTCEIYKQCYSNSVTLKEIMLSNNYTIDGEHRINIDKDIVIDIPKEYVIGSYVGFGLIRVINKENKWGLINIMNEVVIEPQFTYIDTFDGTYATVWNSEVDEVILFTDVDQWHLNMKYGIINTCGDIILPMEYDSIEKWDNGYYYLIKKNGSNTLLSPTLHTIIESEKPLNKLDDRFILVIIPGEYPHSTKYGLIDYNGNEIIPTDEEHSFSEIEVLANGFLKVTYHKGEYGSSHIGILNNHGEAVFEKQDCCDDVSLLDNGFIIVKCKNHDYPTTYILANLQGKEILPDDYAFFEIKLLCDGTISFRDQEGWGMADIKGNVIIEPRYLDELVFENGVANIKVKGSSLVQKINKDGIVIVHNGTNETELPNNVYWGTDFINRISIVRGKVRGYNVGCDIIGVVNIKGNMIIPTRYKSICLLSNKTIRVQDGDCYGIFDLKGNVLFPPIFTSIEYIDNNCVRVIWNLKIATKWDGKNYTPGSDNKYKKHDNHYLVNNRSAICNLKAEIICDKEIAFVGKFTNGYARAYKKVTIEKGRVQYKQAGVIDVFGKTRIPLKYDSVIIYENSSYIRLRKNGKYGIANLTTGKVKMFNKLDIKHMWYVDKLGRCVYSEDCKYDRNCEGWIGGTRGVLSLKGVLVPAGKYHSFELLENGLIKVSNEDKSLYGLLGKDGKEILPIKFSFISPFEGDFANVCICEKQNERSYKKKWGVINNSGEFVKECVSDNATILEKISDNNRTANDTSFEKPSVIISDKIPEPKKDNYYGVYYDDYCDTYYNDDDDGGSYSKYGGYNGWDDNTIDEAFDGNPELTWNID